MWRALSVEGWSTLSEEGIETGARRVWRALRLEGIDCGGH